MKVFVPITISVDMSMGKFNITSIKFNDDYLIHDVVDKSNYYEFIEAYGYYEITHTMVKFDLLITDMSIMDGLDLNFMGKVKESVRRRKLKMLLE